MKLFDLLHKKEYKQLSIEELQTIIDKEISFREFSAIEGESLFDKVLTCFNIIQWG